MSDSEVCRDAGTGVNVAGTRQRLDVWGISVQTLDAAQTQNWHPVLDGYARGVEAMMDGDTQLTVESWLWAANTHGIPFDTPAKPSWDECKHGQRFFLPWHRAYLAWFEADHPGTINDETLGAALLELLRPGSA